MSPRSPKTPQEKKALSYERDRRNVYGENDKSSRKAIPARKAAENRKSRRKANHSLGVVERLDEESAATVESSLRHDVERVGGWKKAPDASLREFLGHWMRRRSRSNPTPSTGVED